MVHKLLDQRGAIIDLKEPERGGEREVRQLSFSDQAPPDYRFWEVGDQSRDTSGSGVGDADGALKTFAAPGIVISDGEGSCVARKLGRETGKDEVVSFNGEPTFGVGPFGSTPGDTAETEDGWETFLEGRGEFFVNPLQKVGICLAARFEKNLLFDSAHPTLAPHLVGHVDEVESIDAMTSIPSGLFGIEAGAPSSILENDFFDFGGVGFAFDFTR